MSPDARPVTPKIGPEEKRRALFRKIRGIQTQVVPTFGGVFRVNLTAEEKPALKAGEADLREREARLFQLSEQEQSDLAADQDTMDKVLTAIRLDGSPAERDSADHVSQEPSPAHAGKKQGNM